MLLLSSFFLGCGGAPASQALATPTMPPDFAITLSSNSVAVTQGNTSSPFTVSVSGQNNFSGSVQITLNGLPSGVISNPASLFTVAAGSSAQLVLGAGSNAATGDFTITAQGVSGSLSHSTAFGLVVQSTLGYSAQVYANPAFNGQPSPYKFLLYDKQRQLLYLSAPASIDLFDLQAAAFKPFSLMLYRPVFKSPGPCPDDDVRGVALTPDASRLVAADFGSQNVYVLNPDTPTTPATAISVAASGYNPTRVATTNTQTLFLAFSGEATHSGMCTACLSEVDLSVNPPAL